MDLLLICHDEAVLPQEVGPCLHSWEAFLCVCGSSSVHWTYILLTGTKKAPPAASLDNASNIRNNFHLSSISSFKRPFLYGFQISHTFIWSFKKSVAQYAQWDLNLPRSEAPS